MVVRASALQLVDLGVITISSRAELKTIFSAFLLDALHERNGVSENPVSLLVSLSSTGAPLSLYDRCWGRAILSSWPSLT